VGVEQVASLRKMTYEERAANEAAPISFSPCTWEKCKNNPLLRPQPSDGP